MTGSTGLNDDQPIRKAGFATTQWSVVLAAAAPSGSQSDRALAALCQTYWYPLYVFVRRRGFSVHQAEDLTQAFFEQLIEKGSINDIRPQGGRFRSFLLKAITNFLNNAHRFETAQKRGGGQRLISLEVAAAERLIPIQPLDGETPDSIFERHWALAVLQQAREAVAAEFASEDQLPLYEALSPVLAGAPTEGTYKEIAEQFDMTESAVKVAVHRLKKKYSSALRSLIAETVASEDDIDDEINYLIRSVRR